MLRFFSTLLFFLISPHYLGAEEIATVDTAFKMLGPNHKIVIEAFDDPKVAGVTCHLSRAKKGGGNKIAWRDNQIHREKKGRRLYR